MAYIDDYISSTIREIAAGMNGGKGAGKGGNRKKEENIKTCVGQARILKGNSDLIGDPGGFSGDSVGDFPVTFGSVAVIPKQWVSNRAQLRASKDNISGTTSGGQAFYGISDTIGSNDVPDVQNFLMNRFPDTLILELISGRDEGITSVSIKIPHTLNCPIGTQLQ